MSRLFLSHSSADNAEAVAIRDWLASEGWNDVFLDLDPERGIAGGERWERALNHAASRCEAVLFLISPNWLESRWCLKEFNLARKLNKRLFGVLVQSIPIEHLPPDLTGAWQVVDLASGQDHTIFRVTLPRTHEEVHVTFSKEGLGRLRVGLAKAGLDPRFFVWPPEHDPKRSPYRGLKPLEADDAGIFFGRDAPIVEALDTLRGLREGTAPRLLVILGASGAGKSSFLRAGLLPRLARDDREFLPLPVIRPERAALSGETGFLRAIETALAAQSIPCSRAQLRTAIAGGADTVRAWFTQLLDVACSTIVTDDGEAKRPVILLAIDQAEELFVGDGAQEGQALLALVRELAEEDRPGVLVLFSIRSDSYDRLETAKALEGVRQQVLPLLPMPRGAYQIVIEGPAARLREANRSLTIEPQLTQRLLEEIDKGGGSDALPLLAFTLELLNLEYGGTGALKLADYETFGGIRGAIEAGVERALAAADNDPRIPRDREARLALLRRGLIPWLAGIDPETGSPRRRVARLADIPDEAVPMVNLLVEQRLLSTDRVAVRDGDQQKSEITIEPAHEALLRQWSLLRGWLEEDFAALAMLDGVKRAARDWAANERRVEWLNHAGSRLEDAEKVVARADLAGDLSADARDYLRECREREQTQQRERLARLEREREEQQRRLRDAEALAAANRRTARRTGIGLAIALVLAALAGWQSVKAYHAAQEEKAQRDRAEEVFRLAINETDGIVSRISTQLEDLVGISRYGIRSILTIVEEQFDNIAKMNVGSARLQLSRARMLSAFVDVFVDLGELAEAQNRANECVSIMRPLVSGASTNWDMVEGLGLCLEKLGDATLWRGDSDAAAKTYRESAELRRRNIAANPTDPASQARLAHVLGYQAYAMFGLGKPEEAKPLVHESLSITSKLVALDKDNVAWQREYAESLNFNAMALEFTGHLDDALQGFKQARDVAEELLTHAPNNARLRRYFSNLLGGVALAMMNVQRFEDARASLQDALKIKRELVRLDAENTLWQLELSYTLSELGDNENNLKKPIDALTYYQEAIMVCTALLHKDPGNNLWRRQLLSTVIKVGNTHAAMGDYDSAFKDYDQAIALDPNYAVAYNERGNAYAAKGDYDGAIEDYDQAIALAPNDAVTYSNRANAYFNKGDTDRAIKDLDQSIALNPKFAFAYHLRGNVYERRGDHDRAIQDYDRAIALTPNDAIIYTNRAISYLSKGEDDRAIEDLDHAIVLKPQNPLAFNLRGNAYEHKGDHDRAIKDYDQAIALDAHYAVAYNQRGNAYFEKGDYDRAIQDYDQAIALNPKYAVAYANRGKARFRRGDFDDAIKDYDKAIELAHKYAIAYEGRGETYFAKGDSDQAIRDYDKAIELDPNYAAAYNSRGLAHFLAQDYDAAIVDLSQAIRLNPHLAVAYNNRGSAYRAKGDYDSAMADLEEAIRLAAKVGRFYYNRGNIYRAKGDIDRTLKDYAATINLSPNDAGASSAQCWIHLLHREAEAALVECEKSLQLRPRDAYALASRGFAHLGLDQPASASADFGAALKVEPKLAESLFGHGLALERTGDESGGGAAIAAAKALRSDIDEQMRAMGVI